MTPRLTMELWRCAIKRPDYGREGDTCLMRSDRTKELDENRLVGKYNFPSHPSALGISRGGPQ